MFQIHREFRKPLIVMSPKNLLRHQGCRSNLSEFDDEAGHAGFDKQGTRFKRLIKDQNGHSESMPSVRRLLLCSGKVSSFTRGRVAIQDEAMLAHVYISIRFTTSLMRRGSV